jgi:hypothetical protein
MALAMAASIRGFKGMVAPFVQKESVRIDTGVVN